MLFRSLFLEFDFKELGNLDDSGRYSPLKKILWLLFVFCYNMPIFVYIFLNTRNETFKIYIYKLLEGRKLNTRIGDASLFINEGSLCCCRSKIIEEEDEEFKFEASMMGLERSNIDLQKINSEVSEYDIVEDSNSIQK